MAAAAYGIPVGLGTDGASSNNSLDLLADVKFLALEQKHPRNDPAAMPAAEAWAIVTGARAPALGQSGRVEVGEPADFVVVQDDHGVLGPGDLVNNLVYAATGAVVAHTVVGGRVVVRDGRVDDEEEIRAPRTSAPAGWACPSHCRTRQMVRMPPRTLARGASRRRGQCPHPASTPGPTTGLSGSAVGSIRGCPTSPTPSAWTAEPKPSRRTSWKPGATIRRRKRKPSSRNPTPGPRTALHRGQARRTRAVRRQRRRRGLTAARSARG